jgi:hypothetical protein
MGDRANFGFKDHNGNVVFLYGHWAGYEMLAKLAQSVEIAESRWNDETYATRITISNLIGDEWTQSTGWGITVNEIADNEHKIPIVDWLAGTFSLHEEASWDMPTKIRGVVDEPLFTMDLQAFVDKYSKVLS